MNQLKYIIVDNGCWEEVIIFTNTIEHIHMMQRMNASKDQVVSAGFLTFGPEGVQCFGRSHSLDISSRGALDVKIINRQAGDNFD